MKRLIPKSHFTSTSTTDTVKERIKRLGTDKQNQELLLRARNAWDSLSDYRKNRLRYMRYVFGTDGDQWNDLVDDGHGGLITERERIHRKTGSVAFQNNHLIKIVNTLTGLYAKTATAPVCFARTKDADQKSQMMTNALQTNWNNNLMNDILTSEMQEMVVGGMPVLTEEWSTHDGVEDAYTYVVDPSYFFFESKANDPRHWDDSLVGEIRDYTLGELQAELARSDYDAKQIEAIYKPLLGQYSIRRNQVGDMHWEANFDTPPSQNLCRTYRIWTLENKPRYRCVDIMDTNQPVYRIERSDLDVIKAENESRVRLGLSQGMPMEEIPLIEYQYINDQYWHFQMLAPDGRILDEYDTPYEHKSHPYTYKIHNFVNGRVVPFISSVIDQQRYINRLITLNDFAIMNAIKGIKMIPIDCVPEGMTNREFAEQFVELGSYVFYTPSKTGATPQVISTNSTDVGVSSMLQLQLGFINDITSVSEALQGKTPSAGTAASRYAMETQNATTSISGLISKFSTFENEVARKKMKVIHQYYQNPRNISIQHASGLPAYSQYMPSEVEDVDFTVSIQQSAASPVGRMMINDLMQQLWQAGQISAQQMLEYSYYPGSEEILQSLRAAEQAQKQSGQLQGVPQDVMDNVTANADQQNVQQLQGALMS